tara:strand:- start:130 stop:627 length:498 start_codon:yes stop_codon:yes gene_type:complete
MNKSKLNGRVNITLNQPPNPLILQDNIPIKDCTSYVNALDGGWSKSLLSETFFSKSNIQILQNNIRDGVYKLSKGQFQIAEQSCDQLKMIMRSLFLQSSLNLPNNITQQIQALNSLVLKFCIPQIYSEATSYLKYIHDASTLVVPISNPKSSYYKTKGLEYQRFF